MDEIIDKITQPDAEPPNKRDHKDMRDINELHSPGHYILNDLQHKNYLL